MSQKLVVIAGPDVGRSFALQNGQTLLIGRGQASHTQINDARLSRIHCRVEVDQQGPQLFDEGSTGGTFVGEEKVTSRRLTPGDVIELGDSKIRYILESPADQTTMAKSLQNPPPPKAGRVPALKDLIGQEFADYRLETIITMGNTGMVYRGTDTKQHRPVAVKILIPDLTHSEEQKERFVRAMKSTLPISHPHIVRLYNAGKKGPFCWAAMEYVEGESLIRVIDRSGIEGMLDWREAWRVAMHVGSALVEAHTRQIIHRNVTPTNIMRRTADKVCMLGDLMLAKGLEGALAQHVTQPGQLMGDLPYMSPERTRSDQSVDGRSDLYGLGATLYALLTGRPPISGESLPVLVKNVREQTPESPRKFQFSVTELFADVVMRLLEKRPQDRYQTPMNLLKDLERIGTFNSLSAV